MPTDEELPLNESEEEEEVNYHAPVTGYPKSAEVPLEADQSTTTPEYLDKTEAEKQVSPIQAHDNWRESWYAKYSKAIKHGELPLLVGGLTMAGVLGEMVIKGPENSVIVNNLTGLQQMALMFGPALSAEIADLIPRTMNKIEEFKEKRAEQREWFKSYCEKEITYLRKEVDQNDKEVQERKEENDKWLAEHTDPEDQKHSLRYYNESNKILGRMFNSTKKQLDHWEKIYAKKFGNKEA